MKYNKRSLAFKVSAIYLAEQRRGPLSETSKELGVAKSVLDYWLKTKDKILSVYYPSTEGSDEGPAALSRSGEDFMGKDVSGNDLMKQNKALRERIDYLEDALCYYRHLMDVEGLKPTEAQKKSARKLSGWRPGKEAKGT